MTWHSTHTKNYNNSIASSKKEAINNRVVLDAKNPIPFEPSGKSNAFAFNDNDRYIPFLNGDDNFFQLLLEASILSPTNNSCINSKTDYTIGQGVKLLDKNDQESSEFIDFAKRVNKKGESFNKFLKKVILNRLTVGNHFVELAKGTIGGKKFFRIINRPFLECRLSEADDDDISNEVLISKKFKKAGVWDIKDDEVVSLPIYYGQTDFEWLDDDGIERCAIHIKNEASGYEHYGLPENISCLPQQILEYKGARYNIDNFENNMVVGGVMFINGDVTDTEAREIGKDLIYSHTGDGKTGRWTVLKGKNIDAAKCGIQSFDTKKEGSFLELDKNSENKIIDANNWDSALYGQHESKGLGNGGFSYISAVYEIKKETVIKPLQRHIKEDLIVPLFYLYDEHMGTKFSEGNLEFIELKPANGSSNIDVNKVTKVSEARKKLGYEPLDESDKRNDKFVSEIGIKNESKKSDNDV